MEIEAFLHSGVRRIRGLGACSHEESSAREEGI